MGKNKNKKDKDKEKNTPIILVLSNGMLKNIKKAQKDGCGIDRSDTIRSLLVKTFIELGYLKKSK